VARSALITGGSSGIGLAIARTLAEDGYALTLVARKPERLEAAAAELDAFSAAADVSREEDCTRVVEAHRDRHGGLDVLVNSAGVGVAGPIAELETKYLDLQLNVNLRGLILLTREALPLLRDSRGYVVNLASIAGTHPAPGLAIYAAAKAAVISFTGTLVAEEGMNGVRATALCPGFVDTPMAEWKGLASDEMIQPEDCAELVRSLLRLTPAARVTEIVIERPRPPAEFA
jgi:NAD(P)-dependent dehydrogenase (short-subunit alcohol dehydrogenase family)